MFNNTCVTFLTDKDLFQFSKTKPFELISKSDVINQDIFNKASVIIFTRGIDRKILQSN